MIRGPGAGKHAVVSSTDNSWRPASNIATLSETIFPVDVTPPALPWTFPEPDGRVADTPQLVSCISLLKQRSDGVPDDAPEPEACVWLRETIQNADERARLETMVSDLIRAFTRDEIKNTKAITEVLCLVPVLNEDSFRFLLSLFLSNLEWLRILDIGALRGLAQLLQTATPSYLHAQDLIEVLGPISTHLQETRSQ